MYDFSKLHDLLTKAGIPVKVAALIFKVSRVTVYAWCKGEAPNQELLISTSTRIIKAIEAAVDAGTLPIPGYDKSALPLGYNAEAFAVKVKRAIHQYI